MLERAGALRLGSHNDMGGIHFIRCGCAARGICHLIALDTYHGMLVLSPSFRKPRGMLYSRAVLLADWRLSEALQSRIANTCCYSSQLARCGPGWSSSHREAFRVSRQAGLVVRCFRRPYFEAPPFISPSAFSLGESPDAGLSHYACYRMRGGRTGECADRRGRRGVTEAGTLFLFQPSILLLGLAPCLWHRGCLGIVWSGKLPPRWRGKRSREGRGPGQRWAAVVSFSVNTYMRALDLPDGPNLDAAATL
ncbi:uncharacterized protein B0T15DRAFT_22465 [Chaetomium strumarium]|uniref:Uncharacterized protein n=1 Tax=Chaetomium strumarium TaxID=1170767 RepID=A0AAJ0H1E8_9PEZI|nr:hypothetical protein B0T15DRAFT_22465 [Chaetomium strumarium]